MKKVELVLIPAPLIGHFSSALNLATLLVNRHPHLSITILIINVPFPTPSAPLIQSLCSSSSSSSATDRIRFITLPEEPIPDPTEHTPVLKPLVESQKRHVAQAVAELAVPLAGFVVDMFCIPMVDVANQFGIPTYVFYTCSASFLAFAFRLQELYDGRLLNSAAEFAVPGFSNPIPGKFIPSIFCDRDASEWTHHLTRRFREARGILVNTFSDLESGAMECLSNGGLPPVYAVGPILNLGKIGNRGTTESESECILKWLDEQPPSSVVFLCFGSVGAVSKSQAREIAEALERTGVRFLWSLRQAAPEGFVERTAGTGRVIGWAPQVEILEHPATGGFVSHCGWNSALESIWHGVPVAAWPMYAEQHFNAFQMVAELGLVVEVSLDYRMGDDEGFVLGAETIAAAITKLMGGSGSDHIRTAAAVKKEQSRKAMMDGGSSSTALDRFIHAVITNSP